MARIITNKVYNVAFVEMYNKKYKNGVKLTYDKEYNINCMDGGLLIKINTALSSPKYNNDGAMEKLVKNINNRQL
jgi:hypothetical protein